MKILGVDGGLGGGLVCIYKSPVEEKGWVDKLGEHTYPVRLQVIGRLPMPTIEITRNKKTRHDYDLDMLARSIRSWKPDYVYLEMAHAMSRPGATGGIVQSFSTGEGHGLIRGLLFGLGYKERPDEEHPGTARLRRVLPRTWQKEVFAGLTKADTKALSATICARRFPDVDWRASARCTIPHTGLTDACCIALYGLAHCQDDARIDALGF